MNALRMITVTFLTLQRYWMGIGLGEVGISLTALDEHESLVFSSLLLSDLEDNVRWDASLFNRSWRFWSVSVMVKTDRHKFYVCCSSKNWYIRTLICKVANTKKLLHLTLHCILFGADVSTAAEKKHNISMTQQYTYWWSVCPSVFKNKYRVGNISHDNMSHLNKP